MCVQASKVIVFLLVGCVKLESVAFFSGVCKMPAVTGDDTCLSCIFTGCLVSVRYLLDSIAHLFSFNLQLRVVVTINMSTNTLTSVCVLG